MSHLHQPNNACHLSRASLWEYERTLDEVCREVWNEERKAGMRNHAKEPKGCRYALWGNPEDLTPCQERKLPQIATVSKKLYRAYLRKTAPGHDPHQGRSCTLDAHETARLGTTLLHPRLR